jgi:hypothetical protein
MCGGLCRAWRHCAAGQCHNVCGSGERGGLVAWSPSKKVQGRRMSGTLRTRQGIAGGGGVGESECNGKQRQLYACKEELLETKRTWKQVTKHVQWRTGRKAAHKPTIPIPRSERLIDQFRGGGTWSRERTKNRGGWGGGRQRMGWETQRHSGQEAAGGPWAAVWMGAGGLRRKKRWLQRGFFCCARLESSAPGAGNFFMRGGKCGGQGA